MSPIRRFRVAAWLAVFALLSSSCAVNGLAFRKDTRFSWVSPESGEQVRTPFELAWEMTDYEGIFAVFFDRTPMAPGDTLLDLVPDSDPCRRQATCPDAEWLADEDIFVTAETSVLIQDVRDGSGRGSDRDPKEVTIVLLDETGRRTSETAFVREFTIDRSEER